MDHPQPVGVAEGVGHLAGDGNGVVDWQLFFALEPVPERLARHERHHVVQQAVSLAAVEQWQDVRMLQSRGCPTLRKKALAAECRAELRVQNLYGDVALMLQIDRAIHGCHSADAELALDPVAIGKRRRKRRDAHALNSATRRAAFATIRSNSGIPLSGAMNGQYSARNGYG